MLNSTMKYVIFLLVVYPKLIFSFFGSNIPRIIKPLRPSNLRLPSMKDEMCGGISKDGLVSAKAIVITSMVKELTVRHRASPVASAALGRSMTCALLMADGMSSNDTIQIHFNGDGPLGHIIAVANGRLEAKGYASNPQVNLPPNSEGKIDVGGGVGKGVLTITKSSYLPGNTNLCRYSSKSSIRSGEVADDVNFHLAESEQRQGGFAAGVHVDDDTVVDAAGGWSVSLLPGATDQVAEHLMANLNAMKTPTMMIREGLGPREIVGLILKGMEGTVFAPRTPHKSTDCCSDERALAAVKLIPPAEVEDILKREIQMDVRCDFCLENRTFTRESLTDYLNPPKPQEITDGSGARNV